MVTVKKMDVLKKFGQQVQEQRGAKIMLTDIGEPRFKSLPGGPCIHPECFKSPSLNAYCEDHDLKIDQEKVYDLIRDYGKRFWAKAEAERIIQHIQEGVKSVQV